MGTAEQFEEYKGKKIALYGLGIETENTLRVMEKDYNIIGLLDGFQEEGSLYGYSIVSLDYVINHGIKLIIAVARPGSCRAIARRIGEICKENKVALFDIRGNDLLKETKIRYNFIGIQGTTKAELKKYTDDADIISFDLFDTLVMRQTLFPEDIAEYVDNRLQEKGILIRDFVKNRLGSEKELSKEKAPSLTEIYEHMLKKIDHLSITAQQLAELEWSIDLSFLVPRKDVCDVFRKLVRLGKKVYVTSDTYYSKEQLEQILKKCGITECTDILSSSSCGVSKTQGLYQRLRDMADNKSVLHIGDDLITDIEFAQRNGFNTCRLFSGNAILELVGWLGFSKYIKSLDSHLRIGMFVSRIFNSPFQFEQEEGRIEILDAYDIGYLFCAPMIIDFVFWFEQQIKKQNIHNVWFSARDGYLFKKIYACLKAVRQQKDESIYFLTSRTAAVRSGVQSEQDILYVDGMKFSGDLNENLRERFGIDVESIKCEDIDENENGLMRYKKPILEKAATEYQRYHKYVQQLEIKDGSIAFFDFVAKGTSQLYVQRLVTNHLKGFYFLQLEADQMADRGLDIQSFYEGTKSNSCAIYDNYYILETLLTAPHSSIQGFDTDGCPIYAVETRDRESIDCFMKAQRGILDYFTSYMKYCPMSKCEINKEMDEIFLKMVNEIKIGDRAFLKMVVEDPFFHRMTQIKDIL